MFVDVHAHLWFSHFDNDRDEVIQSCQEQKITVINTGTDPESNRKCIELSNIHPALKAACGIHPVDIVDLSEEELFAEIDFIKQHAQKLTAIGEVGLDFHHITDQSQQKIQQERLRTMIQGLKNLQKPFIIHSRKAEKEVVNLLEEERCKKVVMHCFTGSFKLAKKIEENGWKLSIPAIILRSLQFQGLVNQTALTALLTETDAPYLAPPPKQRSDPTMVKLSVEKIAEIKGISSKEAQQQILKNYQELFC